MSELIECSISQLNTMKKYPQQIYYQGDKSLLQRPIVSIVGSRDPIQYTKLATYEIANKLAKNGVCVASGGAIGTDAIAHNGAGTNNTICVLANGLDIIYPATNKKLIQDIAKYGLLLSTYKDGTKPTKWSFVARNELVVALGSVLVVTQAKLDSGSMRSVEYAQAMQKEIYVLPHKIGDSEGTNELLKKGIAKAIYNIDEFVAMFSNKKYHSYDDPILEYCKTNPTYEEAIKEYGQKIFEYELLGMIAVDMGKIVVIC